MRVEKQIALKNKLSWKEFIEWATGEKTFSPEVTSQLEKGWEEFIQKCELEIMPTREEDEALKSRVAAL